MKKIYIEGEGLRWVADEKEFALILEEKLGYEAAELFREYINNYHYAIGEALSSLDNVGEAVTERGNDALDEAIEVLEGVMW